MQNFIYLLGSKDSGETLVVDPAWEPEVILKNMQKDKRDISAVILTHLHYDHSNAVEALLKEGSFPVYVQKEEDEFARKPGSRSIFTLLPAKNTVYISGDEPLEIGRLKIKAFLTPGHSPGSQCLLFGKCLLSGDTLFIGGCGRHDLPGGDAGKLKNSLRKIALNFPDDTAVYPGHNYSQKPSNSLGNEKRINPFLKT